MITDNIIIQYIHKCHMFRSKLTYATYAYSSMRAARLSGPYVTLPSDLTSTNTPVGLERPALQLPRASKEVPGP